jgi:hypothetical protein
MGSLGRLPFDALGHHVLSCLGLRELLPVMTTCTGLIAVAQRWTCDRLTEEQIRADELIAVTDLRFVDDETTAPIVPAKVKRPFEMHALVAYLALFSWEARQFGEVLCGAVRQRRTRDAADVLPRVTVLYSSGEAAGLLFDRALQAKSLAGADVDNTRVATVSTMTSRHDDGRASMLLATPTAMAFLRLAHGHYRFDGCTRPQLAFRPRDLFSVRLKAVSYPSAGAEDVPSVRMDDVAFVVLRDVPGRFGGGWVIGSEATPTGLASSRLVSAVSHLNAAANAVAPAWSCGSDRCVGSTIIAVFVFVGGAQRDGPIRVGGGPRRIRRGRLLTARRVGCPLPTVRSCARGRRGHDRDRKTLRVSAAFRA